MENGKTNELWLPGSDFQAQKLKHMITKCQTFNNNKNSKKWQKIKINDEKIQKGTRNMKKMKKHIKKHKNSKPKTEKH